ncbi:DUF4244 domain-containing protein [Aestuariimicrobium sp. p3-SID1156]|uniref:DUF4244 domain-containing protein n=1 Tax=Aestuariimicrobium sp. p3-SID1156 TaxID=2916038 RepID=UPI00223A8E55|nr:DUF4244 domain-containing protein [Aestuariimicrobium sp. p3-SID1156]MCT1458563.1 DUF4244 domain-containing protein [Aestuariimicrobium sp. p3-SID1156]
MNELAVNESTITKPTGAKQGIDLLDTAGYAPAPKTHALARAQRRAARLSSRGMSTAEYAVGILAAITFALVLLRIFRDNRLFKTVFDMVLKMLKMAADKI